MRSGILIGALALLAVIVLGLTYYFRESGIEPQPITVEPPPAPAKRAPPPVPEPEPVPAPPAEPPAVVLPPLDASDALVRERLQGSALPQDWVERDDLIRRLAVVVENARRGELPRRQLSFLAPEGKFQVIERGEEIYIDPASYARYDGYLDILESIPAATAATLMTDVQPLLEQALTELGVTGSAAMPQVRAGIDQLLAVPELRGEVALVQPVVLYEFADPELEGLSALQKQALRMGPDNVRRLQSYLRELRALLPRR